MANLDSVLLCLVLLLHQIVSAMQTTSVSHVTATRTPAPAPAPTGNPSRIGTLIPSRIGTLIPTRNPPPTIYAKLTTTLRTRISGTPSPSPTPNSSVQPTASAVNESSSQPHTNEVTRTYFVKRYTCACKDGFTGLNCEINIDECSSIPCENGGNCTDGDDGYTCACKDGFTGLNCETNIDECSSIPCENGGNCTDGDDGYTCICTENYTGSNCENRIKSCSDSPCQYGGNCTSGLSTSYTCKCPAGAVGRNCEIFLFCTVTHNSVPVPKIYSTLSESKNSIRVSWIACDQNEEHSTVLHGYLLEYSSGDGLFVRNVTTNATTYVVEHLGYIAFQFRVAAITMLNDQLVCGSYSEKSKPNYPKISEPRVEPRNVSVRQLGKDSLVVTWDPVDEDLAGGPIKGYIIRYLVATASDTHIKTVTVPRKVDTKIILNNVTSDAWYKIEVSAFTALEAGTKLKGPFSKEEWIRTSPASGVPPPAINIELVGSRHVLVTWRLPSAISVSTSTDQSIVVLINVFVRENLVATSSSLFNRRTQFIRGLLPGTMYKMSASLNSSSGQSEQTKAIGFETKEEDEWNVTATAYNSTAFRLTWSVPAEYHTANTTLEMLASAVENGRSTRSKRAFYSLTKRDVPLLQPIRTTEEQVIMNGLQPFTVYEINITVSYPNGTELYSGNVYGMSGETLPSAARNVRVVTRNDPTLAEVTWEEPLQPNGRVGYRLRYYGSSALYCSAARERTIDVVENKRWLIANLKPFETYTVEVTSYNLLYNVGCCHGDTEENPTTTFDTPSYRLNAPESVTVTSRKSGGIDVSWAEPNCSHGVATSLHVFYALAVTPNENQIYPLIYSQISDMTETNATTYNIGGADIVRNKTYAIWLRFADRGEVGLSSEIVFGKSLLHYPESILLGLTVRDRTVNSISLQWSKPRKSLLNDDSGIFLYNITWRSLLNRHAPTVHYYYPDITSSKEDIDGYTIEPLCPSEQYEVCVSVATVSREAERLLGGQAECENNETLFSANSDDWCRNASTAKVIDGLSKSDIIPIIIAAVCVALIIAVAVVMCYYVYRWKPAKELEKELDDNILRKFEITRQNVDVRGYAHEIGSGAFGCVFMGWIFPESSQTERVAVKELKKDAGLDVKRDFIREAKISLRVEHPNVVRLMYVCSQEEPYLMIMEFINTGSLNRLLNLLVPKPAGNEQSQSKFAAFKCDVIEQVARGLEAISKENIIHRDIAARNCLVHDTGEKFIIKVSDFGMAVVIDEEFGEVRMKRGGGRVPFWWMSPEAAYERRYSEKSDVWSFGVLCWEVYSCGIRPYFWLSDVVQRYIANRLPLPQLPFRMKTETGAILPFPYEIQMLLLDCWNTNAEERPPFHQIVNILEDMANTFDAEQLATDVAELREEITQGTGSNVYVDDITAL